MHASLLVVHDSRMARSLVRRLLLAEVPDFNIDEACDAKQAMEMLSERAYEVVICNEVLADGARRTLLESFHRCGSGATASYIFILSETTSPADKAELVHAGAQAFLQIPFTGEDVGEAIRGAMQNPRNRRAHRRVSIPDSYATIEFANVQVNADVVNLSMTGMLVDFDYEPKICDLFRFVSLELRLPTEYDFPRIGNIRARALRVRVLSHHGDRLPDRIRVGWEFLDLSDANTEKLVSVIQQADDADERAAVESRAYDR